MYIEKAVADLDMTRQGAEEDQLMFGTGLRDRARACGNVFSESELSSKFLRGVRPDIKPILLAAHLNGEVPFDGFVERALAQGKAHRALVRSIGLRSKSRVPDRSKAILAVDRSAVGFQPRPDIIPADNNGDAILAAMPGDGTYSNGSEQSYATNHDQIAPGESMFKHYNVDLIRD